MTTKRESKYSRGCTQTGRRSGKVPVCAKMGFSPLFVAVTVAWESTIPSPSDGDGITAAHGGGRQVEGLIKHFRFDLGNP